MIREALECHASEILSVLELYLSKSGAVAHQEVPDVALELLSELTAEALVYADRFDPSRRPLPWLLGIAANLVKRRCVDEAKRRTREVAIQELGAAEDQRMSDDEILQIVADACQPAASCALEAQARIDALLTLATDEERHIIRLAVLHDLDGETVARELGIKPGAARTRLSRALAKLRQAALRETAGE